MSKTPFADAEPELLDDIEPATDAAFDALLRSFEMERAPMNPSRVVPLPAARRDPYYLD